ncbi:MAG: hypothetical protein J7507_06640 [Pseudoxanthomonas sp.]|nr:hypothetical protein [Pseudoxanthomonas sp.]
MGKPRPGARVLSGHVLAEGRSALAVPFDVLHLLQRRAAGPKIFGFIAGDEMALYRAHGLVDGDEHPA